MLKWLLSKVEYVAYFMLLIFIPSLGMSFLTNQNISHGLFVGVSRSAKGYSLLSILETLKTFSVEDGLTEEALVTKLRTCRCHYLFLHKSLKHNSSGVHLCIQVEFSYVEI